MVPIMGRYAAREIMTGSLESMLAPYRPERFLARPSAGLSSAANSGPIRFATGARVGNEIMALW